MISRFTIVLIVSLMLFKVTVTGQVKLQDSLKKSLAAYLLNTAQAQLSNKPGLAQVRPVFENDSILNGYLDTAFSNSKHLSYLQLPAMCSKLSEMYLSKGAYLRGIQIAETGLLIMTGNSIKNAKTLS